MILHGYPLDDLALLLVVLLGIPGAALAGLGLLVRWALRRRGR